MAIKSFGFASSAGAGTDNLDDVTSRGATTTNAITVGGVTVGTEYSLPTLDGSENQVLQTNGTGTLSFATLDFTGGLEYKGAFNATAGTPSLTNAEKGDFYIIDTAGTIYGQTWAVGDHLLINEDMGGTITNSKIDKIDNTQAVTSVNTQTGAVVLSGNDLLADHIAINYTAANNNIDGHLSGIDSALGAVASPTLDDVTTNGDTTTNAINVGTITTSGDILADADASRTIGAEDTRFITYFGDMNGAIRFKAKNDEGVQITKGQAVYIKGLAGDGTTPTVGLADADDPTKMPAFGLAFNTANDSAEIQIVQVGNLGGLDTSGFSVGDTLYIDTTAGAVTKTKPTGESSQLQNIGRVIRSDNGDGVIMVGGAGRSAATPNLDQDKIFLGNASNQSVSTALSAIGLSKFNNDSGFLTDITSESLNDLSDVSYTAGAGIDNYVLTYDNTTSSWGAEAVPSTSLFTTTSTTSATYDASVNEIINLQANTGGEIRVNLPSSASNGDIIILRKPSGTSSGDPSGQATKIAVYDNGGTKLRDLEMYPVSGSHILSYDGTDWTFPVTNLIYQRETGTSATVFGYRFGRSIIYADSADTTDFTVAISVGASSLLEGARQRIICRSDRNVIITSTSTDIVDPTSGGASSTLSNSVTIPAHSGMIEIWVNSQSQYVISAPLANLGTSAFLDVGTSANNVVQLDGTSKLPAVDGSQLTNLPGASAASETVAGVIEIATNAEATAGTATDKALVPSNISSLDLSAMDNTTSAFISDITSESLNDLSDVSFTAGAGIDNYVLTYDNSTTSWGAEAVPTASAASETTAGVIEIATNAEATAGTATDKALVPSNISSLDLSLMDNTTSGFITSAGYPTDYTGLSTLSASANHAYMFGQTSSTTPVVTLPDNTSLNDGDVVILSRAHTGGSITLNQYNQSESTARIKNFAFGNVKTLTIDCNRQQFHVRWAANDGLWLLFDSPQALVAITGDYDDLSNTPTALSEFTNDSGFLTNITSESLNDLSDVSFTAGAGIDNYVLTYDNGTSTWGAEAAPTASAASETTAGVIEIATNAEATAGTATDKALVPSNLSSVDLSLLDNTTSAFISDITSESLNDLSDVSFTAGAGIDNYVLTYNHSTTSWGAEATAITQPTLTSASPSANYTISTHDGIEEIYVLTPSANISVFLPAASSCGSGYKYHIKNMASGFTLTIDANSGETIDGSTTVDIANQYEALTLITDGSNWFII